MATRYICQLCNKSFLKKDNYLKHKTRKSACVSQREFELMYERIQNENKKLLRAMKTIRNDMDMLKKADKIKDERLEFYEKQIIPLYKEQKTLGKHVAYQDNSQIINNIINLNMNQIVIDMHPLEKPDTSHISDDELRMWMSRNDFDESFPLLLEKIFFNPKKPLNINWCVTNKNKKDGGFLYNHESKVVERFDVEQLAEKMYWIGLNCIVERLEPIYEPMSAHYHPIVEAHFTEKRIKRQERLKKIKANDKNNVLTKEEITEMLDAEEEPTPQIYHEYSCYWAYVNKCDGVEPMTVRDKFLVSSVGLYGGRIARAFWDQVHIPRPRIKNSEFKFEIPPNSITRIQKESPTF